MSSVWVLALGLAAGYLVNKNAVVTQRLDQAQKKVNEAANPDKLPSEEIRNVQRKVPDSVLKESMNIQDLPPSDVRALQEATRTAAQKVVEYESQMPPPIQGVYLHFDNHGV